MKDLLVRIREAQVASCRCMTKTDDPVYHEEDCLYRILCEAHDEIANHREFVESF